MNTLKIKQEKVSIRSDENQRGSAIVIAVFILALISVFVALALSRTASEAAAVGNETAEGRTFYAAQGSLEMMTRNFNKIFETKLNPTDADLNQIRSGAVPRLSQFNFSRQEVDRTSDSAAVVLSGGPYVGLYAIRDNWRLRTTVTDANGVQVQLTRNILNNRIPIFQFGIFYDDDLELYRPPRFSFGGRVHSNRNFFLSPGTDGIYFDSRVTASKHIVTQTWRNGNQSDINNNQTFIKNASRVDKQLLPDQGSVLNTTAGASNNVFTSASESDLPPSKLNPNWTTQSAIFDGNLKAGVDKLRLPISIGTDTEIDSDKTLIEMIKRGKQVGDLLNNTTPVTTANADPDIIKAERFANKTGIRISLADSKAKLPGCASGTGTGAITGDCGVMLDGHADGITIDPSTTATGVDLPLRARGYQPKSMKMTTGSSTFDYTPTRVNGERLYMGNAVTGRRIWIKVETVQTNATTGVIETKDITQDILSLGVTEQAPQVVSIDNYDETPPDNRTDTTSRNLNQTTAQAPPAGTDSRSIIKIQRFAIPGDAIPGDANTNSAAAPTTKWLYPYASYNFVVRYLGTAALINAGCVSNTCTSVNDDPNSSLENLAHLKKAEYSGTTKSAIVPFPIELFDTREGTFYDQANLYESNKVTKNGVMSLVDIDVANLRRFLRGDFNGLFPTTTPFAAGNGNVGLTSANIPNNNGWVMYVSDRRGDADFDGDYDMEDIYGYGISGGKYYGSDGVLQPGEDANKNGSLDTDFGNEAANKYDDDISADRAAVTDHKFYRRGIRLINGTVIPGIYDSTTPANTRGFTFASENGVYIEGNYNATGVGSVPATGNTPYDSYQPFNTAVHIPASIVADGVTILSNNWNDAKSFYSPYDQGNRIGTTTQMRFAMISGDTIASKQADPHQGGISPRLNGGVHNFKRFLEEWTGNRLDYTGSLINLFNSRSNNGAFKCCNTVYNPPIRNWVFDSTFLDPARLPPGTPFFQYIQTTGFQRTND